MNILSKAMTSQILKHAEEEYPKECCGLIISTGKTKKYIKCNNVSTSERLTDEFTISAEDYAAAEDIGEIIAVVHSHPDATARTSVRDKAVCSEMGIPWVIASWPDGDIAVHTPEEAPLEGRQFAHGTDWDCYGLIRDYYKRNLDIELNRYDHDEYWWEGDKSNFYVDCHEREGFYKIPFSELKEHDLIIMQIRSKVPNHGAIYLGNNLMLHHMFGELSKIDVYGGYWAEHASFALRHKSRG